MADAACQPVVDAPAEAGVRRRAVRRSRVRGMRTGRQLAEGAGAHPSTETPPAVEHHDLHPGTDQRPRRGDPGDARSDHDDSGHHPMLTHHR